MKTVATALLSTMVLACGSSSTPPPAEPEPLVIGKSPAPPIQVDETAPSRAPPPAVTTVLGTGRDPRRFAQKPRARALLVVEIQGLERLFSATQQNAPDRPQLLRRLAEDYVELSRATAVESGAPVVGSADAIKHYRMLLDQHATYAQADEARYFLALEHEMARDFSASRREYYELIKRHPNSKYIPNAYFAFGELFWSEAQADPSKLDLAMQAFLEVLKYPPPGNGVFADAMLRLSQVYDRKGDAQRAEQFARRLRNEFPQSDAAKQLPP